MVKATTRFQDTSFSLLYLQYQPPSEHPSATTNKRTRHRTISPIRFPSKSHSGSTCSEERARRLIFAVSPVDGIASSSSESLKTVSELFHKLGAEIMGAYSNSPFDFAANHHRSKASSAAFMRTSSGVPLISQFWGSSDGACSVSDFVTVLSCSTFFSTAPSPLTSCCTSAYTELHQQSNPRPSCDRKAGKREVSYLKTTLLLH